MRHIAKISLTLEVNDPYDTGIPEAALDELRKNVYEALLRRWGSLTALSPFPFGIADIQVSSAVVEKEKTGLETEAGVCWKVQLVKDGTRLLNLNTRYNELGAVIAFDLAKRMWKGQQLRLVKQITKKELEYDGTVS